jgi:glycosyltransferase involved in cell wall biosynthesis
LFKYWVIKILKKIAPKPIKKLVRKALTLGEANIIKKNQSSLQQILNDYPLEKEHLPVIIFPPALDWNVQLFQRPQQLASALAKMGALVFYNQPKPDRNEPPFRLIEERLYLCNVHVETFNFLNKPWIYLLTWNNDYASCFNHPKIIYDFVDDIDVFYGDRQEIALGHERLLKSSALVLATAQKLFEEASRHREDVILSPNGVTYEHFAKAARREFSEPPEKMRPIIERGAPIIGYYGALARLFDYQLLKDLTELRPNYEFVLIGPDYDGTLKINEINDLSNVHCLGVVPYTELPHYLQFFDVATIPFIINDITHATSPIKLFEYMAAENPVVITPMHESMHYQGVLIGNNAQDFAEKLDQALEHRNDITFLSQLRDTAIANTWDKRAKQILDAIEDVEKEISSNAGSKNNRNDHAEILTE